MENKLPEVAIIMGSASDYPVMKPAEDFLTSIGVYVHVEVVSAHRTPEKMFQFSKEAQQKGIKIIIAGAGGAAHLPGMVASLTPLPVIGVPVKSSNSIDGWDSILSILQMPNGIPVATVALNAALNAGILAGKMLAIHQPLLMEKIIEFNLNLKLKVEKSNEELRSSSHS
jgi:5-(carboxyamino)imidazole ribonucleotide mutase